MDSWWWQRGCGYLDPSGLCRRIDGIGGGFRRLPRTRRLGARRPFRNPGKTADRIRSAVESGARRVVTLTAPLPVHLSYLTSWVNKDGSVHFRDDVYGRDAELARALFGSGAMPMAP